MGGSPSTQLEKDFENLGMMIPEGEHYIGFENKQNICYASSVIQALYHCQPFRRRILAAQAPDDTLLGQICELFWQISAYKKIVGVISINKLMKKVRQLNQMFEGETHHDSHEFFNFVLNEINDYLLKLQKQTNLSAQSSQNNLSQTWIKQIFQGQLSSQLKCLVCESVSERIESFIDLSLDVFSNSSVSYCLKQFSAIEPLTGQNKFYCENCNCKQEAFKRVLIKKAPQILVLHLKRFKFSEEYQRFFKLSSRVVFPLELKLANTTEDCARKYTLYSLTSVIIHLGQGFQYGHYLSIVKSGKCWILFDDDRVELVEEKLLTNTFGSSKENINAPCSYMLLYQANVV